MGQGRRGGGRGREAEGGPEGARGCRGVRAGRGGQGDVRARCARAGVRECAACGLLFAVRDSRCAVRGLDAFVPELKNTFGGQLIPSTTSALDPVNSV